MEELKNNKMFWALIVVTALNLGAFLVGKVVIDKAADRVIERLKKDYSPSPYGPGFDPDKINPDSLKASQRYMEMRHNNRQVMGTQMVRPAPQDQQPTLLQKIRESDAWRDGWEKGRGFNPEQ